MRGSGSDSASPPPPSVPSMTAGASRLEPAASPTMARASPTSEPRIEEEPDVLRRRDRRAADLEGLGRVDREGRDDRDRQSADPDAGGDPLPSAPEECDAALRRT